MEKTIIKTSTKKEPLFKVIYSLERDIENYVELFWRRRDEKYHGRTYKLEMFLKSPNLTDDFRNKIRGSRNEREVRKYTKEFLEKELFGKRLKEEKLSISDMEKSYSDGINRPEFKKIVIQRMEKAFKSKFPFKTITVFLSTVSLSQVAEKDAITLSINYTKDFWTIVIHEINHLMFHSCIEKKLEGKLSLYQLSILLESFTILTDEKDEGYPRDKKIRKFLVKNRELPIDELIDKVIRSGLLNQKKDVFVEGKNTLNRLGFLDRCSYVINDLKRKYNERKKGYFGEE